MVTITIVAVTPRSPQEGLTEGADGDPSHPGEAESAWRGDDQAPPLPLQLLLLLDYFPPQPPNHPHASLRGHVPGSKPKALRALGSGQPSVPACVRAPTFNWDSLQVSSPASGSTGCHSAESSGGDQVGISLSLCPEASKARWPPSSRGAPPRPRLPGLDFLV